MTVVVRLLETMMQVNPELLSSSRNRVTSLEKELHAGRKASSAATSAEIVGSEPVGQAMEVDDEDDQELKLALLLSMQTRAISDTPPILPRGLSLAVPGADTDVGELPAADVPAVSEEASQLQSLLHCLTLPSVRGSDSKLAGGGADSRLAANIMRIVPHLTFGDTPLVKLTLDWFKPQLGRTCGK